MISISFECGRSMMMGCDVSEKDILIVYRP